MLVEAQIDVVLIAYNGEKYIREQIDSILNQTHKNFNLFLCDDASTDRTPSILESYYYDPRVSIHCYKNNLGISKHLSRSLLLGQSAWVAISDQDDIWHKDKLAHLLKSIAKNSLVFCNSRIIDDKGNKKPELMIRHKDFNLSNDCKKLLLRNFVSGHACLFKRCLLDYILPFTDDIIYDHQLAILACLDSGIGYVDHELVYHRRHDSNNWHNASEKAISRSARLLRRQKLARDTASLWRFWLNTFRARSEFRSSESEEIYRVLNNIVFSSVNRWFIIDVWQLFSFLLHDKEQFFYKAHISKYALWKKCWNILRAAREL